MDSLGSMTAEIKRFTKSSDNIILIYGNTTRIMNDKYECRTKSVANVRLRSR